MASSMMHLAIASQMKFYDDEEERNRFYLGTILPDAELNSHCGKANGHFRCYTQDRHRVMMDSRQFFKQYVNHIPSDGLYLGYYFHLIEDNIFRKLLYYELGLLQNRGDASFVNQLHRDYWILNHYIVDTYGLVNQLHISEQFEKEPIHKIGIFDANNFLNRMAQQFEDKVESNPVYFTETMVDRYINLCTSICSKEYEALIRGNTLFQPEDYAWEVKCK